MNTFRFTGKLEATSTEETLDRLAVLARRRRLLFFFGAGFSRAFPSLNPLVDPTQGLPGIRSLLVDIIRRGCPAYAHNVVSVALANSQLEVILDHLALVVGDRAFDFLDLLATQPHGLAGGPNYNHYALALLAKAGFCRTFLTVNFDTLVEEAFEALDAGDLVVPEEHGDEVRRYRHATAGRHGAAAHLFKLHGTLRAKRNLLTTIDVVALGLPRYKEGLLRALLSAHACFFMGYRPGDRDIFPVLSALPPSCEIFWFDVGITPETSTQLAGLLLPRSHRVIINPELPPVLQSLVHRLDVDDRAALEKLGIASLAALPAQEQSSVPAKAEWLLQFAEDFRVAVLSQQASALTMSIALPLGEGGGTMRERLFQSIRPDDLPQELHYAYGGQVAEREWGLGNFGAAIARRRRALRDLHHSALPPGGRKREAIEQRIRTGRDYLALARRSVQRSRWYRLAYQARAGAQFFVAAGQLVAFRHQLTRIERGRLWVMLAVRLPTVLHKAVERQLLSELRHWARQSPTQPFNAQRSLTLRTRAAIAEWLYRLCLRSPASTFGWKSLAMRALAEVMMHRRGICPPEAIRLVADARTERGMFDDLGTHEALPLLFCGAFNEAERVLEDTFRYYRDAHRPYLGGMLKTLQMQALCFALQEKREAAAGVLDAYEALQRTGPDIGRSTTEQQLGIDGTSRPT